MAPKTVINPVTGRQIFVGGPTYQKLKQVGKLKKKLAGLPRKVVLRKGKTVIFPGTRLTTRKIKRSKTATLREKLDRSGIRMSEIKKLPGCGSFGKYKAKDGPFCGPKGGACDMTYPVGTKKRAMNAIIRSVNAPSPKGIRECATSYAVKKGWMTKEDKIRLLSKYK
jgi:hypothetical protein